MKKFISIAAILLMTFSVYSCREAEEPISNLEMGNSNDPVGRSNFHKESEDSLQTLEDNDPDPPIRDGQDWRMGSDKEKK